MKAQDKGIRSKRVQPLGQSLVVSIPKELDSNQAKASVEQLMDGQPVGRFPSYRQAVLTDKRELVIRGLGHNTSDIRKLSYEIEYVWTQAAKRARQKRNQQRRDKQITLVLLGLLAALFTVEAFGGEVNWELTTMGTEYGVASTTNEKRARGHLRAVV